MPGALAVGSPTAGGRGGNGKGHTDGGNGQRREEGGSEALDTCVLRLSEGFGCLRRASVWPLPYLLLKLGACHTAVELYSFWHNCPQLAHARQHTWGSQPHQVAARVRHHDTGYYRHRPDA